MAAWFLDRLRPAQEAEKEQSVAPGLVLAELRGLHERLDRLETLDPR